MIINFMDGGAIGQLKLAPAKKVTYLIIHSQIANINIGTEFGSCVQRLNDYLSGFGKQCFVYSEKTNAWYRQLGSLTIDDLKLFFPNLTVKFGESSNLSQKNENDSDHQSNQGYKNELSTINDAGNSSFKRNSIGIEIGNIRNVEYESQPGNPIDGNRETFRQGNLFGNGNESSIGNRNGKNDKFTVSESDSADGTQAKDTGRPDHNEPLVEKYTSELIRPGSKNNWIIKKIIHDVNNTKSSRIRTNINAIKILVNKGLGDSFSEAELESMAQYSGWGGLANEVVDGSEFDKAGLLLKASDLRSIQSSALFGYYTGNKLITAIWNLLKSSGYSGGRVFEPGCGVGRFISCRPYEYDDRQHFVGIEIDEFSSRICKSLHPDAVIVNDPFEATYKSTLSENTFDLVIGNVPFGEKTIIDENGDGLAIHNYFILKSLKLLRPGGVMAVITSTHTLDSSNSSSRSAMAEMSQLLYALRLPSNTFTHTKVTSDLLIFRKRSSAEDDIKYHEIPFVNLAEKHFKVRTKFRVRNGKRYSEFTPGDEFPLPINEAYISNHPNTRIIGDTYCSLVGYGGQPGLVIDGDETDAVEAINYLGKSAHAFFDDKNTYLSDGPVDIDFNSDFISDRVIPIGGYFVNGNAIYMALESRQDENGLWLIRGDPVVIKRRNAKGSNLDANLVLMDYVKLRELAADLLDATADPMGNEKEDVFRKQLNSIYDAFISKYGFISSFEIRKIIKRDALCGLALSLEKWDSSKGIAEKADILLKSLRKENSKKDIYTFDEAVSISLSESGTIDTKLISNLCKRDFNLALKDNPDKVFLNPETMEYEHRCVYLYGNIFTKLKAAKEWLVKDDRFSINVQELNKVMPPRVVAKDIFISMGTTWIPDQLIIDFINSIFHVANSKVSVKIIENDGLRDSVEISLLNGSAGFQQVMAVSHGTKAANFDRIITSIFHSTPITISKLVDGKQFLDHEESLKANNKAESIKDMFSRWIVNSVEISQMVENIYNERINVYNYDVDFTQMEYEFKGLNKNFTPRKHQINFVLSALFNGNMLNADCVGAGKTAMQIMLGIELSRLGIAKLPVIVVPNHMLLQTTVAAQTLYPAAKICAVTKDDFVKENRSAFVAKMTMNRWDLSIITYSMFEQIQVDSDYLINSIENEISELTAALKDVKEDGDRISARQILRKIETANNQLSTVKEKIESNKMPISLSHTGIDAILYDEYHKLKNLALRVTRQIPGVSDPSSAIAFNEYCKMQFIMERYYDGKEVGVYGFTATPISNSLVELYTLFRQLKPSILKYQGISNLNAFVAQYGDVRQALEILPEGQGYQIKSRLSRFKNIPELLASFRSFAQVHSRDDLKLPSPEYDEQVVVVEQNIFQKYISEILVHRARHLRSNGATTDNFLAIVNDATLLAISQNALYPDRDLPEYVTKLDHCADNVYRIYLNTITEKLTQLIFLDKSVPSGASFNSYSKLKKLLIDRGIPPAKIAFVHDYKTDEQKQFLIEQLNEGDISIVIASTEKFGVGTNAQKKLIALHEIDIPWTPKDMEQRLGRIVRDGNENKNIYIYRYTTKGSFDVFRLETIKRKAIGINMAMKNPRTAERIYDEEVEIDFDTLIAETTDNPIVRDKAKLDSRIMGLQRKQNDFYEEKYNRKESFNKANILISKFTGRLDQLTTLKNRVSLFLAQQPRYVSQCSSSSTEDDRKEDAIFARLRQAQVTTFGYIEGIQENDTTWISIAGLKSALICLLERSVITGKPEVLHTHGESVAIWRKTYPDQNSPFPFMDYYAYFDPNLCSAESLPDSDDYLGIYHQRQEKALTVPIFKAVINFIFDEILPARDNLARKIEFAHETIALSKKSEFPEEFPELAELNKALMDRSALELKIAKLSQDAAAQKQATDLLGMEEIFDLYDGMGRPGDFNPYEWKKYSALSLDPPIDLTESDYRLVTSEDISLH